MLPGEAAAPCDAAITDTATANTAIATVGSVTCMAVSRQQGFFRQVQIKDTQG